jgi:hypothetical protein
MAKIHTSRKIKALDESFAAAPEARPSEPGLVVAKPPRRTAQEPSLRDRLADYFRAGHNASDRELAALFGASVGSISVYRCQLKKLGVAVASPPAPRGAGPKRDRRPTAGSAAPARPAAAGGIGRLAGKGLPRRSADAVARLESGALSLVEIDQVLIQNIETELGLIVERYPELARAVANVQQTVRLLLKLHRQ